MLCTRTEPRHNCPSSRARPAPTVRSVLVASVYCNQQIQTGSQRTSAPRCKHSQDDRSWGTRNESSDSSTRTIAARLEDDYRLRHFAYTHPPRQLTRARRSAKLTPHAMQTYPVHRPLQAASRGNGAVARKRRTPLPNEFASLFAKVLAAGPDRLRTRGKECAEWLGRAFRPVLCNAQSDPKALTHS